MVEAEAGGDQGQQAFLYFACALYDPVHAVYRFSGRYFHDSQLYVFQHAGISAVCRLG